MKSDISADATMKLKKHSDLEFFLSWPEGLTKVKEGWINFLEHKKDNTDDNSIKT